MKTLLATAALVFLFAGAAEAGEPAPTLLPAWIVSETPLQPDARPVRASALLPHEAWSGRGVGTLADAFRRIPGAIMLESFGGFEPPRLSIRGSGLQSAPSSRGVALLLDELPLGLADGSFNSALFDPLLGGRIEVQRGLDGWRAAPATLGGALDLRSARPAQFSQVAEVEGGSFGARRARAANVSGGPHAPVAAALSFAQQDGYREHSAQRRTATLASASTASGFTATVYHAHARYEVPGPLTLTAAFAAPGSISADVQRDRPARVAEITRASAGWTRFAADRELEIGVAWARTADDFRQLRANGVTRSRSDDASVRAAFAQRFATGPIPHQFRLTAAASRGWRDVRRSANANGTTGAPFANQSLYPTTATLQVEDTFALAPKVVATVGLAQLAARREIVDRVVGGALRPDENASATESGHQAPLTTLRLRSRATLPQASLRWQFAKGAAVFASVSRAAEPPTFDDLIATAATPGGLVAQSRPLDTQTALTWEIGARGRTGSLSWDLAAYHSEWRREILRLADANGAARGSINASPTTHEGVEASVRWTLLAEPVRVSLNGSAVWTHFAFDDDPVYGRNRLAGLPPHIGQAELLAEFPRGTFLAAGADWTAGRTAADHAGRLSYSGRTLAHVRIGWRGPDYWTLFAEVRNVFDRRSIASTAGVLDLARNPAATAIFLPAPGRAFTIGIEWRR